MKRYIHGHAVLDGVTHSFCYDRTNPRAFIAVPWPVDKAATATVESPRHVQAIIQQQLEVPEDLQVLTELVKVEDTWSPYWVRQRFERMVIEQLINDTLSEHGTISVNDGEEWVLKRSGSRAEILGAMFSTEEEYLLLRDIHGETIVKVRLIYGNDGWDVMADHSYPGDEDPAGQERVKKALAGADNVAAALCHAYS